MNEDEHEPRPVSPEMETTGPLKSLDDAKTEDPLTYERQEAAAEAQSMELIRQMIAEDPSSFEQIPTGTYAELV